MTGGADDLVVERSGGVVTVTFDRPEVLNAFRRATYERLHALLGELAGDATVRAVVLTGRGRAFCSGEDLRELDALAGTADFEEHVASGVRVLQEITQRIVESDAVFIAAVNGVAAGFGAELAVACDVRVTARSARFLFPEVRRGLFITNGVSYLLPRLVGRGRAAELLLTGAPVGGEEAERIGLATRCVDDADCVREAQGVARQVAENASLSVALTKRILLETTEGTLAVAMAREEEYAMACFRAGGHEEGGRAFLEKRAARFGGR